MRGFKAFVWACCAVAIFGTAAMGTDVRLLPISASGVHSISGDEITLEGGGQRVVLEIVVEGGWPGLLKAYEAGIDSVGYASGLTGTLAPPEVPCVNSPDPCPTAIATGSVCPYPPTVCPAGFVDTGRSDYIFFGYSFLGAVDTSTLNYRYGYTLLGAPISYTGGVKYLGALVLDVPVGAMGTFTIEFISGSGTALLDSNGQFIPLTTHPALVTVTCQTNADCNDNNECTDDTCETDGTCSNVNNYDDSTYCCDPTDRTLTPLEDGNECTYGECNPDGTVSQQPHPEGTTCGNPASDVCDAQDTCDGAGVCVDRHADSGTACGDPGDTECDNPDSCDGAGTCGPNNEPDGTACTDDGNECSDDVCASGACTHPPEPYGKACGDPNSSDCDNPDICDGAGACDVNYVLDGTPCTDDGDACTDNVCAAGACTYPPADAGTPCGDPTDTECDDPDTCDGAGVCLDNLKGAGFPCGDSNGNQCDNPDSCDGAGTCLTNYAAPGKACGNPADTECDDPDTCDGAGACVINNLPNNTPCTDDGNQCRDDICLAGVCSHPPSGAGTPCGDPTDTDCNGADTCNGGGTCLVNLEPAGAACGDPTTTDCDRADTCNGAGTCLTNLEPADTACGDPSKTDCDNPDTCDGAGTCLANVAPPGLPCGNQVGNQCDNPDTCDGAGTCEPNFVPSGTACGNPADTVCDNPDSCDGSGVCAPNREPDGTLCTDDGNACRDDICVSGACTHPTSVPGTPCGDPTDTDCNAADTCDGAGTCQVNLVAAGTPCGDPEDTLCTNPDSCNGLGTCVPNHEPDGTDCDQGFFCVTGTTCLGGICGGGTAVNCNDGLACTSDSCNEDTQQCDNILVAGYCLIDGVCYADAEFNPDNDCEVCTVSVSTSTWDALAPGTPCDDGDPCTGTGEPGIGIDTCNADGDCTGTVDPNCNDDCINAVEVFDGSNIGNNENRGPDDDEASCQLDSDNDVWFFYVANCTGPVGMDTIGSFFEPENDTVLTVYEACGGAEVECDDDGGPELLSALAFQAADGVTYYIRIAGFLGNAGDIVLNIYTLDGCVIDDLCYAAGEPNPANECEACIPLLNSTGWSSRAAGTPCGDPTDTDCDSPDACDGYGLCEQNYKADQELCPDDGNDCTSDVCFSGICTHPPKSVGTACGDPTATECDNPDSCDGTGICLDNFAVLGLPCGDPSTSDCDNADVCDGLGSCDPNHQPDGLDCPDDEVECTSDVCETGQCTHPPKPVGTACGDSGDTDCDNPDTCDGDGTCLNNYEASGTDCGNPADTECDNPDTCNGAGGCLSNYEPTGFACGDPTDTDCDNPDTCNGAGVCRDNLELAGFPCGDPNSTQCDRPDTCDGVGICLDNFQPLGLACGDPSTSECDNADRCDGLGACDPNHQPDGLACGDDGFECTYDECDTGVCEHPPRPVGTACGDATDTECDNPDTCDAVGGCLDNYEPTTTTCGDPADTECDNPDTCDGAGSCLDNYEEDGFSCGSPADTGCDNPDTCDGAGLCLNNYELTGFPCGDPSNTQCDNPDTCDGLGGCLSNYEPLNTACGDPADTECDNPDICDGGGACVPNHEPDGTSCTDDGNDCRDDVCETGACTHPPFDAGTLCGDPTDTECDNPNTCDGDGLCLDNYESLGFACGDPSDSQCDHPDTCDGGGSCGDNLEPDGTSCDDGDVCTGEDQCQTGLCGGTAIPEAPLVDSEGPRYISVAAQPAGSVAPVALKVTSPTWTCLSRYVDADGLLVADPVYQLPDEWGTIIVQGPDIVPSSTYNVVAECGTYVSPVGSASTALWGDIVGPFDGTEWTAPDGRVDVLDMTAVVEGFEHHAHAPEEWRTDLWPCTPDDRIDVMDMTMVTDAFQGVGYFESTGCPVPCP